MKQEHYTSFELCKKLTEAWFPWTERIINDDGKFDYPDCDMFACPSVMELLDELPADIIENYRLYVKKCSAKSIYKENDEYIVYYRNTESGEQKWGSYWGFCDELLPNALAEMWLWCKENNYLP